MKVKTIHVHAKEWFDKVNGNSYFSAVITLNFGLKTETELEIPFQYGYGDHYRHVAFQKCADKGYFKDVRRGESYWRYYERKNIKSFHNKQENCKKRELKALE